MNVSRYEHRPDAELEGLAAGGDREAFAELYSRHFDRVYDFSLRLLRDAGDAEDVAQETFLKAMAALSPKRKTAAFTTWILTIARNTALNRLRAPRPVAPSLDEAEQGEAFYREVDGDRLSSPEEALQAKELAGLVWQAATALDPKQHSLLDLHLRQGLNSGEIAEVLGTSKNNAYVMMSRLKDSVEESVTTFIMARRGRRDCAGLDELLTGRAPVFFDADTRKAIARHIDACRTCQEQRKKLVSPAAVFGALAAVPAPVGLKQRALAEALGQWPTLAGSEAGKAGGLLSRLTQPLRSRFTALRETGWLAGWRGAALLVGGLLIAGGIGGGALLLSGVFDASGEQPAHDQDQRTLSAAVGVPSTREPTPTLTPTTPPPSPTPTASPSYYGAIMGLWRQEGESFYIRENGTGIDYRMDIPHFDGTRFEGRPILFVRGEITGQVISAVGAGGPRNSQTGCDGVLEARDGRYFIEGGNRSSNTYCDGLEIIIDEAAPLGSYNTCPRMVDCPLIEVDAAALTRLVGQEVTVRVRWCYLTKNGRLVNPVVAVKPPVGTGIGLPPCAEPYPQ